MGAGSEFIIHNPSLSNSMRAVLERVFFIQKNGQFVKPPAPNLGLWFKRLEKYRHVVRRKTFPMYPITRMEFVDYYQGTKRQRYLDTVADLELNPLKDVDSHIIAFVKAEKIKITPEKMDPAPRIIQPRHMRFNVEVGVFLKPLEKKIYKIIDRIFGTPTVFKSYNAFGAAVRLRAKWDRFRRPVAVQLDISRMDEHVHVYALRLCHSIYANFYHGTDRSTLLRLLKKQLKNFCRIFCADGKVKYSVIGRKMSGDMDTALGNVIIMCGLLYSYLDGLGLLHLVEVYDNGDDAGIIMEEEHLELVSRDISHWFEEMGFTLKVEGVAHQFEQINFCKTRPVFDGNVWRMVRDFPDSLDKDATTVLPVDTSKAVRNWHHDIGYCGLALTSGVPVLQSYYLSMIRSAGDAKGFNDNNFKHSGMYLMARGLEARVSPVTDIARVSFYNAFGVTPYHQLLLEKLFDETALPMSHTAPVLRYLMSPRII